MTNNFNNERAMLTDLQAFQAQRLREAGVISKALQFAGFGDVPLAHSAAYQIKTHTGDDEVITKTGLTLTLPLSPASRHIRRTKIIPVSAVLDDELYPLNPFDMADAILVQNNIDSLVQDREWQLLPNLSTKTFRFINATAG